MILLWWVWYGSFVIFPHSLILFGEGSQKLIGMTFNSGTHWQVAMTTSRNIIIVVWVFWLIIYVKIRKVLSHFIKVLFHFLLVVVVWRQVLCWLIVVLLCLPGEVGAFGWELGELLSETLSLVLFRREPTSICLWDLLLLRLEEILLRPGGLHIHFVQIAWSNISWLVIILHVLLLLLWDEVIRPWGRVISPIWIS